MALPKDGDLSEETRITFGKNCKAARIKARLSQGQLAALIRFPQSTLSRIEAGRVNMTLQSMVTIAQALQVDLTKLIGKSTPK